MIGEFFLFRINEILFNLFYFSFPSELPAAEGHGMCGLERDAAVSVVADAWHLNLSLRDHVFRGHEHERAPFLVSRRLTGQPICPLSRPIFLNERQVVNAIGHEGSPQLVVEPARLILVPDKAVVLENLLQLVWKDGKFVRRSTLAEIRERVR